MKSARPNILITEPQDYSPRALAVYRSCGKVSFLPGLRRAARRRVLAETEVLVVCLAHRIDRAWLDRVPALRMIATPTTGLNHIDLDEARHRGIRVLSLRGHPALKQIPPTAELTLGLLLALLRRIPWAHEDVLAGRWDRIQWRGHGLAGKILGILGFGRLGRIVTCYGRAFGMRVIACDPYVHQSVMERLGVRKVSMRTLFRQSDVVSVHVLLNDDTYGLITVQHLRSMKPGSVLINTARGEIIQPGALEKALKRKWIAGAGVDVLWDEESNGNHLRKNPLVAYAKRHTNLLITPHIGGATYEAMQRTEEIMAELVRKHLRR